MAGEIASPGRATNHRPMIGVFDSGVGGLTVLRALLRRIPDADYLYFGDTARLPYGSKSAATVAHYAVGAAHYLQDRGAELLVIACNTATALALNEIKAAAAVEVIGVVEPGAEAAAAASRKRNVVVIGTEATINSHAYRRALEARKIIVREKACPLLVPLVEEGWLDTPVTEQAARTYTIEALRNASANVDVLVLGCTHYPLLRPLLRRVVPQRIQIVDSAEATACALVQLLGVQLFDGYAFEPGEPSYKFFVTDSVEKFRRQAPLFLGFSAGEVERADLDSEGATSVR